MRLYDHTETIPRLYSGTMGVIEDHITLRALCAFGELCVCVCVCVCVCLSMQARKGYVCPFPALNT